MDMIPEFSAGRVKTIEYTDDHYSRYKIRGKLILVDQDWREDDIVSFSCRLSHNNFLPGVFPIKEQRSFMYYESNNFETLKNYEHRLMRDRKIYPAMTLDEQQYHYIPDEYRRLFRSMISFITVVHYKGYCTTKIGYENLLVWNDVLKFGGIGFQSAEPHLIQEDYKAMKSTILEMLQEGVLLSKEKGKNKRKGERQAKGGKGNIQANVGEEIIEYLQTHVPVMHQFLECLDNPDMRGERMVDDVAIISLKRVTRFLRVTSESRFVINEASFDRVMEKVESSNGWLKVLLQDALFNSYYKSPEKPVSIEGGESPRSDAEEGEHEEETKKIRDARGKRNHHMMRFLRNVIVHGAQSNRSLSDGYMAIAISNLLPSEIRSLQKALQDKPVSGASYLSKLKYR